MKTNIFGSWGAPTLSGLVGTGLGACIGGIPGAVALGTSMGTLGLTLGGARFVEIQASDLIHRFSHQAQEIICRSANYLISGVTVGGFYWLASGKIQESCQEHSYSVACQSLDYIHLTLVSISVLGGTLMIYKATHSMDTKTNSIIDNANTTEDSLRENGYSSYQEKSSSNNSCKKEEGMNNVLDISPKRRGGNYDPKGSFYPILIKNDKDSLGENFIPNLQKDNPNKVIQYIASEYLGLAFVEIGFSGKFSAEPLLTQEDSIDLIDWCGGEEKDPYYSAIHLRNLFKTKLLRAWELPSTTHISEQNSTSTTGQKTVSVFLLLEKDIRQVNHLVAQVAIKDKLILQQRINYPPQPNEEATALQERIAALIHSQPILFHTNTARLITFEYPRPIYQNFLLDKHRIVCLVQDKENKLVARVLQTSSENPSLTKLVKEILPENVHIQGKNCVSLTKLLTNLRLARWQNDL